MYVFLRPILIEILKVSKKLLANSDNYKSNACSLVLKRIKFPKTTDSFVRTCLSPSEAFNRVLIPYI